MGPIYSGHIPSHAIRESIRFLVRPIDGVAVDLKPLGKNFEEELCVFICHGRENPFSPIRILAPR